MPSSPPTIRSPAERSSIDQAVGFPFAYEVAVTAAARSAAEQALAALSVGSRRALLSVARGYLGWCRATAPNTGALPADANRAGAYLAHVKTRAPSSVALHRWALRRWHALLGMPDPFPEVLPAVAAPSPDADLPPELEERLRAYYGLAARAFAPATRKALRGDLRLFRTWCAQRGVPWLPAAPETVQAYVEEVGATRKPATIGRYLSSITAVHRAAGLPSPCTDWPVALARRAHSREKTVRQRQAKPVGNKELAAIFAAMDDAEPRSPAARLIDLRDCALLLVGRDTLARADELAALRWEDVTEADPARDPEARVGEGTIRIRRSKTDQEGQGAIAWLSAETMAALAAWRAAIEAAVDPATGRPAGAGTFLFRSLARRGYGARLQPAAVRAVVMRRMGRETALTTGYGGHSLRVGAAQDLLAAGVNLPGLMQAGRWKTSRMPARYTEELQASRSAVAQVRRAQADAADMANDDDGGPERTPVRITTAD
ncbi:tyrosine-type recombinase/integrase [Azospirillum canadense]|uniref:tyrosine-type recombinase/integrase n=1 Tax=Azospirillum canadense TaxID=403962 RepID=UPI002225FA75|nr:tyrosine-type recombinase/integrase [Azospirillum canadense]MCW2239094.1 site-specific recombinase XerD [Azospirillum canadense]